MIWTRSMAVLLCVACTGGSGGGGDGRAGGGGDGGACPASMPSSGDPCSGSAICNYGTESCCGNTYPSYRCDCQDGSFVCMYTDACLIPGCPDASTALPDAAVMCPTASPSAGESCSGSMHCEYGSETCCGNTYPSYVCDCREGRFDCLYTDACLIPGCPDAAVD